MYKTCIYCNRGLGTNEALEHFSVGRRLAYDAEKGRLWVICERCRRWNLSPMHERWEAIEECERLYHDTPTRFSTDNIGLARLPEGVELVRVGKPLREEFAAWRYAQLRLGVRHNLSTNDDNAGIEEDTQFTAGLGFSPFGARLDISGLVSDSDVGAAIELGASF